jgi:anti-sigma regulatory factor (Ser/Thr protein kinase)
MPVHRGQVQDRPLTMLDGSGAPHLWVHTVGAGLRRVGVAVVEKEFDGDPGAPRRARRFVAQVLDDWGYQSLIDDAMVVASELATNAVMHAHSSFTLSLAAGREVVRISIRDASVLPPARRESPPLASSGRGLGLVAGIATAWGTEAVPGGKVVWAELRP